MVRAVGGGVFQSKTPPNKAIQLTELRAATDRQAVGRLQSENKGGHMHQVYGFGLFVAGLAFIALSGYLLINGGFFAFGGIVLVAGAALFCFLLCVTGYRMSQRNL